MHVLLSSPAASMTLTSLNTCVHKREVNQGDAPTVAVFVAPPTVDFERWTGLLLDDKKKKELGRKNTISSLNYILH